MMMMILMMNGMAKIMTFHFMAPLLESRVTRHAAPRCWKEAERPARRAKQCHKLWLPVYPPELEAALPLLDARASIAALPFK